MKQAGPCLFCSARCLFNLFTQANGVPAFEYSLCLLILFLSFFFIFAWCTKKNTSDCVCIYVCRVALTTLFPGSIKSPLYDAGVKDLFFRAENDIKTLIL